MTHRMPNASFAEGLALIADGLNHLEAASTAEARQSIVSTVRGVLRTMANGVGYPEALTWPADDSWTSPYGAAGAVKHLATK